MFCTAWPAAPLPKLSSAERMWITPSRSATASCASFVFSSAGQMRHALVAEHRHERVVRVEARVERQHLVAADRLRAERGRRRRGCRAAAARRAARRRSARRCRPRALLARSRADGDGRSDRRRARRRRLRRRAIRTFGLRPAPVIPLFASMIDGGDPVAERSQRHEREQRGGDVAAGVGDRTNCARSGRDSARANRRRRLRCARVSRKASERSITRAPAASRRGRVFVRDFVVAGQEDDVVRADAGQRGAALLEADPRCGSHGKMSTSALPALERLSSVASATSGWRSRRRMSSAAA